MFHDGKPCKQLTHSQPQIIKERLLYLRFFTHQFKNQTPDQWGNTYFPGASLIDCQKKEMMRSESNPDV